VDRRELRRSASLVIASGSHLGLPPEARRASCATTFETARRRVDLDMPAQPEDLSAAEDASTITPIAEARRMTRGRRREGIGTNDFPRLAAPDLTPAGGTGNRARRVVSTAADRKAHWRRRPASRLRYLAPRSPAVLDGRRQLERPPAPGTWPMCRRSGTAIPPIDHCRRVDTGRAGYGRCTEPNGGWGRQRQATAG
jgi:hypothetical protein